MSFCRVALLCPTLAAALMCTPSKGSDTKLRIPVPKEVADQAARRVAGDAKAPPPILMLEGLEFGDNEGLTIKVLGEPEPGSAGPGPVLAVTGVVGQPQKTPKTPLQKINLPVPLNDTASQLLSGHNEVTLTLKLEGAGTRRAPIKVDRAFFVTESR
jgi:hypothetical protein